MKRFLTILFFALIPLKTFADTDVIREVFNRLNQDYLQDVQNEEIALKGLESLNKIDSKMTLKKVGNQFVLFQNQKVAETFDLPENTQDKEAWITLSKNIINRATSFSERLDVLDFELPDRFAQAVFENLDGYSHYFSAFEDETEKPFKIQRQFAARIIDDVMLIKILSFQKGIAERVKTTISECSKCSALILDLRANGGGFLNEAIEIADLFLDEGIITYTSSAQNDTPHYFTANSGDIFAGKPIVLISDGKTASAAEVLIAALTEQDRAVLIGTRTHGKGTVQDVTKMASDRAISVTTSLFYTPSGQTIEKRGLTPLICTGEGDSCAPSDRFGKEEDIEAALRYLKEE
ncbi:MAG: hypothetical protein J5895_04665 [Alphaproteobacteria bacterium]|nr:hypothetical protein [Alphaproteobacteria bacterium]